MIRGVRSLYYVFLIMMFFWQSKIIVATYAVALETIIMNVIL